MNSFTLKRAQKFVKSIPRRALIQAAVSMALFGLAVETFHSFLATRAHAQTSGFYGFHGSDLDHWSGDQSSPTNQVTTTLPADFLTTSSSMRAWYRNSLVNREYAESIPLAVLGALFVHGEVRGNVPYLIQRELPTYKPNPEDLSRLKKALFENIMLSPALTRDARSSTRWLALPELNAVKSMRTLRSAHPFQRDSAGHIKALGLSPSAFFNLIRDSWSDLTDLLELHEEVLRQIHDKDSVVPKSLLTLLESQTRQGIGLFLQQTESHWLRLHMHQIESADPFQSNVELRTLRLWMFQSVTHFFQTRSDRPSNESSRILHEGTQLAFSEVPSGLRYAIETVMKTRAQMQTEFSTSSICSRSFRSL